MTAIHPRHLADGLYRFASRIIDILGAITLGQGVIVLLDSGVTSQPAWHQARFVPIAVWGVLLIVGGGLLLTGRTWNYWAERAGAWLSMVTTLFLAALFVINAVERAGAGAGGALSWLLIFLLLFVTVVLLGREG